MSSLAAHADNYPGKYVVPIKTDPHANYLPRGPPIPIPSDPNVVRFTANAKNIRHAEVIDHTNSRVFRFSSSGKRHLQMYDAADELVASYDDGKVVYRGDALIKGKKFVKHGAPGKTGTVFIYNEKEYELVQELFYAVVRKIPHCERVAIIYNYTGKLAIEMIDEGIGDAELQTKLVFVTALEEIGLPKRGLIRAVKRLFPSKKY